MFKTYVKRQGTLHLVGKPGYDSLRRLVIMVSWQEPGLLTTYEGPYPLSTRSSCWCSAGNGGMPITTYKPSLVVSYETNPTTVHSLIAPAHQQVIDGAICWSPTRQGANIPGSAPPGWRRGRKGLGRADGKRPTGRLGRMIFHFRFRHVEVLQKSVQ